MKRIQMENGEVEAPIVLIDKIEAELNQHYGR